VKAGPERGVVLGHVLEEVVGGADDLVSHSAVHRRTSATIASMAPGLRGLVMTATRSCCSGDHRCGALDVEFEAGTRRWRPWKKSIIRPFAI
jgi:hypothetical protein